MHGDWLALTLGSPETSFYAPETSFYAPNFSK
jgi:hypothetical protein